MIRLEKFEKEMYSDLISWIGNAEELLLFAGPKFTFPLTTEQLDQSLSETERFAFQVVSEENNLPIGHCEIYLTNHTAALGRILIGEKSFRGKGLGKMIVVELLKYIEANMDRKKVELNVFDFNRTAIKCYEKVGFRINPDKKLERIVNGKKWIALHMTLDLESRPKHLTDSIYKMELMTIQIMETEPSDTEVGLLIEALSTELGQRFGDTGENSFKEWEAENSKSVFVKAILAGEAVGCGAIRPLSDDIAEVKRMYSKYNRKGIGKTVLDYLENKAKELGYQEIWLETRKLNQEACAFYLKNNYVQIPNFGKYVGNEKAICFGKYIDADKTTNPDNAAITAV